MGQLPLSGVVQTPANSASIQTSQVQRAVAGVSLSAYPLVWVPAADELRPLLGNSTYVDGSLCGFRVVRGGWMHPTLASQQEAWLAKTALFAYPFDNRTRASLARRPWGHA